MSCGSGPARVYCSVGISGGQVIKTSLTRFNEIYSIKSNESNG